MGQRWAPRGTQPRGQSAGTTCTEVMEPLRVVVMRSCMVPMSVANVGW